MCFLNPNKWNYSNRSLLLIMIIDAVKSSLIALYHSHEAGYHSVDEQDNKMPYTA